MDESKEGSHLELGELSCKRRKGRECVGGRQARGSQGQRMIEAVKREARRQDQGARQVRACASRAGCGLPSSLFRTRLLPLPRILKSQLACPNGHLLFFSPLHTSYLLLVTAPPFPEEICSVPFMGFSWVRGAASLYILPPSSQAPRGQGAWTRPIRVLQSPQSQGSAPSTT